MTPTTLTVLPQSYRFAGPGGVKAIHRLGCPRMPDRRAVGWLVPRECGENVLAWLQGHGYPVQVTL
jgi:hypothetical protein